MPANFPEVWLNRVINKLTLSVNAPWLDGIPELDVEVVEIGGGSLSESNEIHIPVSEFEPDVLINNTTYPLALQDYTDDEVVIKLDKYQTKATTLSDDQVIGAAYNKIDNATKAHTKAITTKKYAKAIHALAPASNATATPVILTTGAAVGGSATRKRFDYADIVEITDRADAQGWPLEGRRMVLSSEHKNDLLLDRKNFGDVLVNYKTGDPAPMINGWKIFWDTRNPFFTTAGAKVPFASVPAGTDKRATVVFCEDNVAKKTGLTKQYFTPAASDTETQANKLNFRHYFICCPMRTKYIGAIASGVSA